MRASSIIRTTIVTLTLSFLLIQTTQTALSAPQGADPVEAASEKYMSGNLDEAYNMLENLIDKKGVKGKQAQKTAEVLTRIQLERGYTLMGKIAHRRGNLEDAVVQFKKAAAENPAGTNARFLLALVYFDKGDYASAEPLLKDLAHKKCEFQYVYNLAVTQERLGKKEESIASFKKAIAIDPASAEPHFCLGEMYQQEKDYDNAIAKYNEALSINPKFAEAYNNLGVIHASRGDFPASVAAFQKALELKPKYTPAMKNLGYAEAHTAMAVSLMSQGKAQEAHTQLCKAIEIDPEFADAHYNMGLLLHQEKRLDDAIAEYQAALKCDSKHARAHNNLGVAYASLGKVDLARNEYAEALRLKPDYSEARTNLSGLTK